MHFIILFPHNRTFKRNRCRSCLNTRFIPSVKFWNNTTSSMNQLCSFTVLIIIAKNPKCTQDMICDRQFQLKVLVQYKTLTVTPLQDLLQWTLHWPYVTRVLIIYTIIYTIISLRPNTVWIYYVQSNSWLNVLIHFIQSRNSLALAEYCSPFSPQNYFKHSDQALSTKENGREVMSC